MTKQEIFEMISKRGKIIVNIPNELQNDREIVLTAIRNNGLAIHFSSKKLQEDNAIISMALLQNDNSLENLKPRKKKKLLFNKF